MGRAQGCRAGSHPSASGAPPPPHEETPEERAQRRAELEESWLDTGHTFVAERLFAPVIGFDRFFSDETNLDAERSRSFLRWRNELRVERGFIPRYTTNLRADLRLPALNRVLDRLRFVLEGQTRDVISALVPDESDEVETIGNGGAELRLRIWEGLIAHGDIGAGSCWACRPARSRGARLRWAIPVGGLFLTRVATSGFWRTDTHLGTSVDASLERGIKRAALLRLSGEAQLTEVSRGVEWSGELCRFRAFTRAVAGSVGVGVLGATDAEARIERYSVATRVRGDGYRRWLFLELEPEVYWPWRARLARQAAYAVTFRVEVQFRGWDAERPNRPNRPDRPDRGGDRTEPPNRPSLLSRRRAPTSRSGRRADAERDEIRAWRTASLLVPRRNARSAPLAAAAAGGATILLCDASSPSSSSARSSARSMGGSRPFRCPDRGGAEWRALASDHFVVRTDLDAAQAAAPRRAARANPRRRRRRAPGRDPGARPREVIAFRSAAEYAPFAPDGAEGYHLRSEGGPPRIVLAGALRPDERALLAHELTHHFLAGAFQRQPRWFAEGVAVSMESLGADVPGHAIVMGAPPEARLARARVAGAGRRAAGGDGTPGGRDALDWYAASWLLVDYLRPSAPTRSAELQRRLVAGEPPEGAWRAAFPDHDPARAGALEALDDALAAHARGQLPAQTRELEVPAAIGYFEERIPAAEVHAIRLALWAHGPKKPVGGAPGRGRGDARGGWLHPIALQYRAALWGEDPLRLARAAVSAHPRIRAPGRSSRARLDGTERAAEREDAFRRASELAPGNAAALHNLASELLAQGRSGEAPPVARQAVRAAPWSPPLLAGLAAVLSDLGQCAAALPMQQRAIEALPERAPAQARHVFEGKLDAYARQCRVASGAAAPAPAR